MKKENISGTTQKKLLISKFIAYASLTYHQSSSGTLDTLALTIKSKYKSYYSISIMPILPSHLLYCP
jgi:hypothetical protein